MIAPSVDVARLVREAMMPGVHFYSVGPDGYRVVTKSILLGDHLGRRYETIVLAPPGGDDFWEADVYASIDQATAGHNAMVRRVCAWRDHRRANALRAAAGVALVFADEDAS